MEATEIDKELEELDTRMDQLRALYEQYFMGIERLEPQKPRQDVERRVKVLRKEQIRNTAQRFKFNVLVQRLTTMQQYWARTVREIENGTFKRDVIRAAARFGAQAVTGVPKKHTQKLLRAAAEARMRSVEDPLELDADDLIEDDEPEADDVPTPTKLVVPLVHPAPVPGLSQHDLPLVTTPRLEVDPLRERPALAPAPQVAMPSMQPSRSVGPLWGEPTVRSPSLPRAPAAARALEPNSDRDDRQRRPVGEESVQRSPASGGSPAASSHGRVAALPPSRVESSVRPTGTLPIAQPAHVAPRSGGFGVLDIPFEDVGAPAPTAPSPSPAASAGSGEAQRRAVSSLPPTVSSPSPLVSGPRPRMSPPSSPAVLAPRPSPSTSFSGGDDLSDQRIRQIYAKYVETKRASNESTAGVTFEKLALSLRSQAERLKAAHPSKSIDYEVVIKDGKTHIKPVLR